MAVLSVDALPLGFRFRPTDVELVDHYLKGKIRGSLRSLVELEVVPEIDLCKCEPWDLPGKYLIKSNDPEWFFFSPKDRKYSNGQRSNRATRAGYWKATGRDRKIMRSKGSPVIGMKRTLVFYRGRAPRGVRSKWIMHEYRTTESEFDSGEKGGFVLCRLFRKSEDNITTSEVDVCAERDVDEAEELSPLITRSSEAETADVGEATPEGPTSLHQNIPQLEMQADSQSLHLTSNTQPTSANVLSEDRIECESLKLDDNCSGSTAASDNAYNEIDFEGVEVAVLLGDLAQLSGLDHNNYPALPSMEFTTCDEYNNGLQPNLFQSDSNVEDDCVSDFLDTLFITEDLLPETSNAIAESSTEFIPEGQKCMIADRSVNDVVLSKESKTCSNEDIRGTTAWEDIGLSEVLGGAQSYPSYSSNLSNCLLHMQEGENQVTYEQNACSLDYSENRLYHEFEALIQPMTFTEFSRDLSSNQEIETIQANLDNTGIQLQACQNFSGSESLQEYQGLTRRRVLLQKSMHNVSVAKAESESITFSGNVHKSIISEVGKYEKKVADEGTTDGGSGYVDNAKNTSGVNMWSTSYEDNRNMAGIRRKRRWALENAGESRGCACESASWTGSKSMIRVMMIMLSILLLLFVVISWSVMK